MAARSVWNRTVRYAVVDRLDSGTWLAGGGCVPHVRDRVTFYGGVLAQPLHGIEINGCRVYDAAPDKRLAWSRDLLTLTLNR